jgi:hypothetical protein
MKLQIDTTKRTIKIDESVNFGELFQKLEQLLPNNEWKGYLMEIGTLIEWVNPIITYPINPYWPPTQPFYYSPEITCGTGVYNIQL